MEIWGAGARDSAGSRAATGPPPGTRPKRRVAGSVARVGACSAGVGSAATFFALEGRAARGAVSGTGIGFETGGAVKGSSGVTVAVAAVDFLATFFAAVFLAAVFLTAVFLTAAFFAAALVAAFLATRWVAGGVSWSLSLLIRNRLEIKGLGAACRSRVSSGSLKWLETFNVPWRIDSGLDVIGRGSLVVTGREERK